MSQSDSQNSPFISPHFASEPALSKELPIIKQQKVVAESRLFKIEQLDLTFSNGAERVYERMRGSGRGAVLIVPIIDESTMLLVREYSAGTHDYQLGFPKGLIDPGETIYEAANRELMEEIGYGANKLVPLKEVSLAPGYFNAKMNILLAMDLYPSKLEGDEPEPLEVVNWQVDNTTELLLRTDFTEARSVAALFLAERWLQQHHSK
ncbi:ADP compounds hydrolase NudE [Flocculibacter collagenilyticus]|uniref:ADP compounds hydrolase NudE n=1 Tax=Flocculibacter collagenilyticus TaxID=2744479 RepID=UPI0018F3066D|nr:ADP compounds hydrolase NudE [Flocculibacter collagenilyticus]